MCLYEWIWVWKKQWTEKRNAWNPNVHIFLLHRRCSVLEALYVHTCVVVYSISLLRPLTCPESLYTSSASRMYTCHFSSGTYGHFTCAQLFWIVYLLSYVYIHNCTFRLRPHSASESPWCAHTCPWKRAVFFSKPKFSHFHHFQKFKIENQKSASNKFCAYVHWFRNWSHRLQIPSTIWVINWFTRATLSEIVSIFHASVNYGNVSVWINCLALHRSTHIFTDSGNVLIDSRFILQLV